MWNALPDDVELSSGKKILKNQIKYGRTLNCILFNKVTFIDKKKRKENFVISRIFLT